MTTEPTIIEAAIRALVDENTRLREAFRETLERWDRSGYGPTAGARAVLDAALQQATA